MVVNATFNIISDIYRGGKFFLVEEIGVPEENVNIHQYQEEIPYIIFK